MLKFNFFNLFKMPSIFYLLCAFFILFVLAFSLVYWNKFSKLNNKAKEKRKKFAIQQKEHTIEKEKALKKSTNQTKE